MATMTRTQTPTGLTTVFQPVPRWKKILTSRELALLPVIALALVIGAFSNPNFLTLNNLLNNVLVTSATLGLLVLAMSIILIGGFYDLSLESVVALAPVVAAWLIMPSVAGGLGIELPSWLAFPIIIVVGLVVGGFNALLIAKLKLNAFIVTLAMLILLRGITLGISGGRTFSNLPAEFTFLGSTFIAGISIQVWILLIAFVVAALFMQFTATGRNIYAMGGNPAAARAAGVKTTKLTVGILMFGSVLAAFAGMLYTARIASVTAAQGDGMIFTVFAAAVIGGISLNGGRGGLFGALTGVLLLGIIQNILTLSNVPSFWINAVYGAIILGALVLGRFTTDRKRVRQLS